jgi:hypothetical protein
MPLSKDERVSAKVIAKEHVSLGLGLGCTALVRGVPLMSYVLAIACLISALSALYLVSRWANKHYLKFARRKLRFGWLETFLGFIAISLGMLGWGTTLAKYIGIATFIAAYGLLVYGSIRAYQRERARKA